MPETAQPPSAAFFPGRPRRRLAERDLITFFFAVALVVLLLQALNSGHLWAIGWVALGASVLMLKRYASVRFVIILELPIFLSLVAYSASSLYLLDEQDLYDFVNDPTSIEAAWLALGGMACFLAGLGITVTRPAHRWRPAAPPVGVTHRQVIIVYLVGLLSSEGLARVAPMSLAAVAYTFGLCIPISLFIHLKLCMDSEQRWLWTPRFFIWLLALLAWTVRSMLGGIFGSTLLILAMYLTQQIHRSYVFVAAGLALMAIFAPLIQDTKGDYRQRLASGMVASERALQEVVSENFRRTFYEGDMVTYRSGLTQLAERLCTFEVWLRVKRHMDTYQDFAKGRTILDALLFGFVPRILWPDKPITGGANTLAEQYADMVIAENTSVGVGMISEFYINGGTWAVLLGMLGLGMLGGAALMRGWFDNVQPLGMMSGILAFSLLVRSEANLTDVLGGFIRILFLWWVLRTWITRSSRRPDRGAFAPTRAPSPWNPPPA